MEKKSLSRLSRCLEQAQPEDNAGAQSCMGRGFATSGQETAMAIFFLYFLILSLFSSREVIFMHWHVLPSLLSLTEIVLDCSQLKTFNKILDRANSIMRLGRENDWCSSIWTLGSYHSKTLSENVLFLCFYVLTVNFSWFYTHFVLKTMNDAIQSSTDHRGYVYLANNCRGVEFILCARFLLCAVSDGFKLIVSFVTTSLWSFLQ